MKSWTFFAWLGMSMRMNSLASRCGVLAGDEDFIDVFVIEIADGSLDEVAFLVNQARRGRLQRKIADIFPQPQQILEITLDFRLLCGPRRPCG